MDGVGTPDLLLDRGADPHHFQLRPSQARAVAGAGLVVWIGPDLTPWLGRTTDALSDGQVLELLAVEARNCNPTPNRGCWRVISMGMRMRITGMMIMKMKSMIMMITGMTTTGMPMMTTAMTSMRMRTMATIPTAIMITLNTTTATMITGTATTTLMAPSTHMHG